MIDYFSHIPISHLATYCIIFVGDVTELMFTVNGARCTKVNFLSAKMYQLETTIKQHFKQITNGKFIKMDLQELPYINNREF